MLTGSPPLPLSLNIGVRTLTDEHRIPIRKKGKAEPGTIFGNYLCIADKPGGVEPGFVGIEMGDDFYKYVKDHFIKDLKHINPGLENSDIKQAIQNNPEFAEKIAESIHKKEPLPVPPITWYMFKQDYVDPGRSNKVNLPIYRAFSSNAIKAIQKKAGSGLARIAAFIFAKIGRSTPSINESTNAVLECIANDISRKVGIQCQDQTIVLGTYANGNLKVLTRCAWQDGLQKLGVLSNAKDSTPNYSGGAYYILEIPGKYDLYLSDDTIKDLGEFLPIFIAHGDRDVIGSRGQNKFKLNGKIFGLDFGHAYRGKNPLLASLADDFSFKQPKGNTKIFKNMSAFYDTPLREKMKGMYYMQKMITGVNPSEDVLIEYGAEFKEKISAIQKGDDQKIFDEYISRFTELQAQAAKGGNKKLVKDYEKLIAKVKEAKTNTLETHEAMLKVFEKRLALTPRQLDLLEALEKLTSTTSLRSPDHKVLLNFMRVTKRVKWDMEIKGSQCILTAKDYKNVDIINALLGAPENLSKLGIKIESQDGEDLKLSLDKSEIENVLKILNEDNIQQYKHSEDYRLKGECLEKLQQASLPEQVSQSSSQAGGSSGDSTYSHLSKNVSRVKFAPTPTVVLKPNPVVPSLLEVASRNTIIEAFKETDKQIVFFDSIQPYPVPMEIPAPKSTEVSDPTKIVVSEDRISISRYDLDAIKKSIDVLYEIYGTQVEITISGKLQANQKEAIKQYIDEIQTKTAATSMLETAHIDPSSPSLPDVPIYK